MKIHFFLLNQKVLFISCIFNFIIFSSAEEVEVPVVVERVKEEMFDESGDTEEEIAANRARHARMAAAKKLKEDKDAKDGKVKVEKAKPVEKSLVVLDVKPWEADTDLEMVFKQIIQFEKEGLSWGQGFKLEPIAYGIKKLVMQCVIVDALILMDDITDAIEAIDQFVQSVQVVSMTKI